MIEVFGSEWCANCKVLGRKLRAKGVTFTYIDVDEVGLDEVLAKGVQGLPHVVIAREMAEEEVFSGVNTIKDFDKIFGDFFAGEGA